MRELAIAVGVDNSYVARQLRLTLLAPDLVEAILDGDEPDGVSLEKLYGMPVEWEEQRRVVGVAAGPPDRGKLPQGTDTCSSKGTPDQDPGGAVAALPSVGEEPGQSG